MWYLIIGLILIGLLIAYWPVVVAIAALYVVFKAFSWAGVVIAVVGVIVLALIPGAWGSVQDTLKRHDKEKKETAKIYRDTQNNKLAHENEMALRKELDANCRWLGHMTPEKWAKKLPNYVNKQYNTSFVQITNNFATQMEQQNIRQNDDWFKPFLMYVVAHPQGSTVTKMLNEVYCPQFHATHKTPDGDLLNTRMIQGTKPVNKDVPALFQKVFLKEMNENIFTPTKYALHLYGDDERSNKQQGEEINFDDL